MEPEGSLPRSQDPAACTCPQRYIHYHQPQYGEQKEQLEGIYESNLVTYY